MPEYKWPLSKPTATHFSGHPSDDLAVADHAKLWFSEHPAEEAAMIRAGQAEFVRWVCGCCW